MKEVKLEDVRAALDAGNDKLAVKRLWLVHSQARDAVTLEGVIVYAERIGARSRGGRLRECEDLVSQSNRKAQLLDLASAVATAGSPGPIDGVPHDGGMGREAANGQGGEFKNGVGRDFVQLVVVPIVFGLA